MEIQLFVKMMGTWTHGIVNRAHDSSSGVPRLISTSHQHLLIRSHCVDLVVWDPFWTVGPPTENLEPQWGGWPRKHKWVSLKGEGKCHFGGHPPLKAYVIYYLVKRFFTYTSVRIAYCIPFATAHLITLTAF